MKPVLGSQGQEDRDQSPEAPEDHHLVFLGVPTATANVETDQ
jgi:hypothetical protein